MLSQGKREILGVVTDVGFGVVFFFVCVFVLFGFVLKVVRNHKGLVREN